MIVRILGEGQYTVPDERREALGKLDDALAEAVDQGDQVRFAEALAALTTEVRSSGVALADDAYRSWKAGTIQTLAATPQTLADGGRTTAIGTRTFEVMFAQGLVDEVVLVTEEEIAAAIRVAWSRLHLALEPTGALPLAAYLSGKLPAGRTGLILSGGNANLETVATLLRTP